MFEQFYYEPAKPNHHEVFKPGEFIECYTEKELCKFEDELGHILNPNMSHEQDNDWALRKPIDTLIRPDGYDGPIVNIQLAPMDGAFDWLEDAKLRGHRFVDGFVLNPKTLDRDFTPEEKLTYLGFHIMGYAVSRGVKRIEADVWYVPQSENKNHASSISGGIRRYVSRPEHLQSEFDQARKRSIKSFGAHAITPGRIRATA